jgi:hypothetical protein
VRSNAQPTIRVRTSRKFSQLSASTFRRKSKFSPRERASADRFSANLLWLQIATYTRIWRNFPKRVLSSSRGSRHSVQSSRQRLRARAAIGFVLPNSARSRICPDQMETPAVLGIPCMWDDGKIPKCALARDSNNLRLGVVVVALFVGRYAARSGRKNRQD